MWVGGCGLGVGALVLGVGGLGSAVGVRGVGCEVCRVRVDSVDQVALLVVEHPLLQEVVLHRFELSPEWSVSHEFISHNVFIKWFQKVDPPTQPST